MPRNRSTLVAAITGGALAVTALAACDSSAEGSSGDAWEPSQDVTITVAFPAGGGTDGAARALAEGLESVREDLNVVVVNRDGGSGTVGYTHAQQQSNNPHELTFVEPGFVIVPETTEVGFSIDDFNSVGGISLYTSAVIAPNDQYEDLEDLIASAEGETLTVGFPNATGPQAISTVLMEQAGGVEFEHIVYQNGGEIAAAVASGDLDFGLTALEHAEGFISDGRVEALAVLADEPVEQETYADVPTAQEAGLDVSFSGFRGLVTGGDLAEEELEYWVSALDDYRASEEYQDSLELTMTQELDESGEDFQTYLGEFTEVVSPILPELGS